MFFFKHLTCHSGQKLHSFFPCFSIFYQFLTIFIFNLSLLFLFSSLPLIICYTSGFFFLPSLPDPYIWPYHHILVDFISTISVFGSLYILYISSFVPLLYVALYICFLCSIWHQSIVFFIFACYHCFQIYKLHHLKSHFS